MAKGSKTHVCVICSMCGDAGFAESIVTCSGCKNYSEHIYCMQGPLSITRREWLCDECRTKENSHSHVNKTSTTLRRNFAPETAKVKLIPAEEAVLLSSNGKLCTSLSADANTMAFLTKRRSLSAMPKEGIGKRTCDSHCNNNMQSLQTVNARPLCSFLPPIPQKKPRNMASNEELKVKKVSEPDAILATKGVVAELKSVHDTSNLLSYRRRNYTNSQEMVPSPTLLMNPVGDLANGLLPKFCWEGTLNISDMELQLCCGAQAYFPHQVSYKVYEISKKMPREMHFEVKPRALALPVAFELDPPTLDDIALYFLSSDCERSKEKYKHLLEYFGSHDVALQCLLDGANLLICSSEQFTADSGATERFLWGVFRSVKHKRRISCDSSNSSFLQKFDVPPGCSKTPQIAAEEKSVLSSTAEKDRDVEAELDSNTAAKVEEKHGQTITTEGLKWKLVKLEEGTR
ncbi:uncharacterized protein LOC109725103 isoform X2 [Ananas comosus]|uniref:Uncharacterized protein LOC109725103 isoform X2 n=1 Tax=Ananas comosus TaxID=4615 RepID=A0A6P5GPP3_ANACO|nr:uncharacterized protein LOC109725103 isoform X2 [Ananas comosus]